MAVLFLLLLPCRPAAAAQPVIRIVYPDYWPFFTKVEQGHMAGFFYEIVTEALNRMGVKACWDCYPWGRCQALVRSGEEDAMITVPTPERLRYTATHAEPFYRKELRIFTYAGHPKLKEIQGIKTIDDIKALGLSVVTYTGNGWNNKHIREQGIKTYEAPLIKSTWRMLASRHGDIAIEWPGAAWPSIREAGLADRIVETDVALEAMPFHLMIARASGFVSILHEFNKNIIAMQRDGTIGRILRKYEGGH